MTTVTTRPKPKQPPKAPAEQKNLSPDVIAIEKIAARIRKAWKRKDGAA